MSFDCSRFSVSYGSSESVEKQFLITMVTTPPPNACSRDDLFTISASDSITYQSPGLVPPLPGCYWSNREQSVEPSSFSASQTTSPTPLHSFSLLSSRAPM
ncbi:hypothetical protein ILYODFUR_018617 [Ilyodon furcidens]|uniref:Uncharacterized protein n=1 Tax=Ilyodon furcidens TaxID=33524 RepID=A0ABV0TZW3_9TELE